MSINIISGINGAGKTSMTNFIVGEIAFDYHRERMCDNYREFIEDTMDIKLPRPECYVYTNYDATFKKEFHTQKNSIVFEASEFGLPEYAEESEQFRYFHYGSAIVFDEAQKDFPSSGKDLSVAVKGAFEEHRHYGLDIYMPTTRAMLIHKSIRELANGYFIKGKEVYEKGGEVRGVTWYFDFVDAGNIDFYLNGSVKERGQVSRPGKIHCPYNIYKTYDSQGHAEDFYKHIKKMII